MGTYQLDPADFGDLGSYLEQLVEVLDTITSSPDVPDAALIALADRTDVEVWSDRLEQIERGVRRLRGRILAASSGRHCEHCFTALASTPTARFCSPRCRLAAHRTGRPNF